MSTLSESDLPSYEEAIRIKQEIEEGSNIFIVYTLNYLDTSLDFILNSI